MRKRVTFVESLSNGKGPEKGPENGQSVTRSAEASSCTSTGFEVELCQKARKVGAHISASAGNKAFYFPKYMTTAPFLQHPSLTPGQRRYLHSISNIYSTEQMRRQMRQHYLDVLHSCLQSGQIPVGRRRCADRQFQQTQKSKQQMKEKETRTRDKPPGRSQSGSNVRLPKIVHR